MRYLFLTLVSLAICVSFTSQAYAKMLTGSISNSTDVSGFLAEIDQYYPCWLEICRETVRLHDIRFRKQFWFDQTFFTRDDKIRKEVESLAKHYGVLLII